MLHIHRKGIKLHRNNAEQIHGEKALDYVQREGFRVATPALGFNGELEQRDHDPHHKQDPGGHPAVLEQRIPPAIRPALEAVRQALPSLLATHLTPYYRGPLGIDMMVVRSADHPQRLLLHPCVEINLRPTMGYAALWASRRLNDEGPYLFNPDAQTPQELFLKWEGE